MWFKMHPWVFPIIIGGIGVLYLILNIGAIIETKKIQAKGSDHHISGIPFLGGIHILIAGLISPIKWLALLCVLDYTFWSFLYSVFIGDCFKKIDAFDGENQYATDVEKDRMKVRPVKTSGVCVGDVIVCLLLVIFSVAGFMGENVILGYLAGVPAVLLFPYLTLKRPFFKADVYGILYRKPTNFGYGKAESIKWEQVEAIIAGNQIFSIDEKLGSILENKLNAETLSGFDAFDRVTEEEYEDQAEWIENGFFIVIKPAEEEKVELLDLGSFFHQNDFLKKLEMLKALWLYHLKSSLRINCRESK
ncbi:hypothetical protein SAMN02910369_02769 [Lachnospiraceae bacterium NE2001]|nr:hypothetical protein SAMN02910369_02769 [Lachnospiraceae bacterium NE2001]